MVRRFVDFERHSPEAFRHIRKGVRKFSHFSTGGHCGGLLGPGASFFSVGGKAFGGLAAFCRPGTFRKVNFRLHFAFSGNCS